MTSTAIQTRSNYDEETRERALHRLAINGGNCRRTSRELKAQGINISDKALGAWMNTRHRDRYMVIREETKETIAEHIAADAEQLAVQIAEAEQLALTATINAIQTGDLDPKELSGALRNLTTSKALQIDKIASPLRGRPTTIHEHRNPTEIIAKLNQLAPGLVIDSTAKDITDSNTPQPNTTTPNPNHT